MNILDIVKDYIIEKKLLSGGERLLLCLSAGKDSVFLLNAMLQLKESFSLQIEAFHLNHQTRGEESDSDEIFISDLCRTNGIPIHVRSHRFENEANFEEAARTVRYQRAEEIRRSLAIDSIVTAHTRSDNAETVLMRLFTGTSIHGMSGIPARRGNIIRPLLSIGADQIYEYLNANQLSFREDSSNSSDSYTRNFVRNRIIAEAVKRFPDMEKNISSFSEECTNTGNFIYEQLGKIFLSEIESDNRISYYIDGILGDRFALKHFFSEVIRNRMHSYVTGEMLDEILKKLSSQKPAIELYGNTTFCIEKKRNDNKTEVVFSLPEIIRKDYGISECGIDVSSQEKGYHARISDSLTLSIHLCNNAFFEENKCSSDYIFLGVKELQPLTIRQRKNAEYILIAGTSRSLKKIFQTPKLSTKEKTLIPVFEYGGAIAAIGIGLAGAGVNRVSDNFLVSSKSKKILAICRIEKLL